MESSPQQAAQGDSIPSLRDCGPRVAAASDKPLARRLKYKIDWPTAILLVSLLSAGYYLRRYMTNNRLLMQANRQLQAEMEQAEVKSGDLLFAPVKAEILQGAEIDLLDPSRESAWVIFSVHCAACRGEIPKWLGLSKQIAASHIATHFISLDTRQELNDYFRNGSTLKLEIAPPGFERSLT